MDFKASEDKLAKSGCSYLENSQYLFPDIIDSSPKIDPKQFQFYLQQYQKINPNYNFNQKFHFEYSGQLMENISYDEKQNINEENHKYLNGNEITNNQPEGNLSNSFNNINIKKENKFLTKSFYVGFVNNVGDNSCYINTILQLLENITDLKNILKDIFCVEVIKSIDNQQLNEINNESDSITKEKYLLNLGEIIYLYDYYIEEKAKENEVEILNPFKFRKNLDKFSEHIFKFNSLADPIELLLFILDILNDSYKQQIHNNFYLNLIDQSTLIYKNNS